MLHGPFILLQSLLSTISIVQASADDSDLGVVTGKQNSRRVVFPKQYLNHLNLSSQENKYMTMVLLFLLDFDIKVKF